MSAYAGYGSGAGGSAYATPGAPATGTKNPGGGGGILGFLGSAGHWLASKGELAGHDIAQMPGGLYHIAKDTTPLVRDVVVPGNLGRIGHDYHAPLNDLKNLGLSSLQSLEHPGRDPFQTLLTVLPAAGQAAKLGEAGMAASDAARAGEGAAEAAKAAGRALLPHEPPVRTLKVGGRLVRSNGATMRIGSKDVSLLGSRNAAGRLVQRGYDAAVQHALDQEAALEHTGRLTARLAKHGMKRAAGAGAEEERLAQRIRGVPADMLDRAAGRLAKVPRVRRAQQAALELTSTQTPPEVAIGYHMDRAAEATRAAAAARGAGDRALARLNLKAAKQNRDVAGIYQRVAAHDLVHVDPSLPDGEKVFINPAHERLAQVDRQLAKTAAAGDQILAEKNVMSPQGMTTRVNAPGEVRAGEQAFPGRNFTSYRISEKTPPRNEFATGRTPVTGVAKPPVDAKEFTGKGIEQGLVPKHITGMAARHYRQIIRFVNTDAIRRKALDTSSPVRRSARDVLIRVPDKKAPPLTSEARQILGQEKSMVDTPQELAAVEEGLRAAHTQFVHGILDRVDRSKLASIGKPAPEGYRWVDENMIRDLQQEVAPRSAVGSFVGKIADRVNAAVTALTVYFKIGHLGTRTFTNAATNIMQGSLRPDQFRQSIKLWEQLPTEDKLRMLGGAGQQGYAALPTEGTDWIARSARTGARMWARRIDAPFRFNSLAYELRKAGYKTVPEVQKALDAMANGGKGLAAHEWSKISAAFRRADREAISYDRLNAFEHRYLARAVWFYPWVKGSTMFTIRSMLEHPVKMGGLEAAGVQGRQEQAKTLGPVPSYEEGLIGLTGGDHPLTTDFSTFSPFATAGQVASIPEVPGSVAGQFNPALAALGQYAYGLNQYGAPSKSPVKDALLALLAPTPEQQLAEALAARGENQSNRMFQKTPGSTALRYLVGPAMPRRVNKSALAKAAAREKSGQR